MPTEQKPAFPKFISSDFADDRKPNKKEISKIRLNIYNSHLQKVFTPKKSMSPHSSSLKSGSKVSTPNSSPYKLALKKSESRSDHLPFYMTMKPDTPQSLRILSEFTSEIKDKQQGPSTTKAKDMYRSLKKKHRNHNENALKSVSKYFDSDEGKKLDLTLQKYFGKISEIPYKLYLGLSDRGAKLYITDIKGANDLSQLRKLQINAVLSIGVSNTPYTYTFIKGGYMTIDLEDNDASELPNVLPKAIKFLDLYLSQGNVIVHDYYGTNRACAVVVLYLMKKFSLRMHMAIKAITEGRPCCNISQDFKILIERFNIRGEL